ncbi:MAG: hypothetical protein LBQ02_00665 [Candidatus Nomurabacteria bacterium]|nr:hypothetical protein [Candidatus Nomurabacteria bacterium]
MAFIAGYINQLQGEKSWAQEGDVIHITEEIINVERMQDYNKQYVHQTSELTITDPGVTDGYFITAKLASLGVGEAPLATDYVRMYSDDSARCPSETSCPLLTNGDELPIYDDTSGVAPDGKKLTFYVDFTIPPEVVVDTYHIKIEYNMYRINQEALMQNFTKNDCAFGLQDKEMIVMVDGRDWKKYHVRKFIVDGASQCWMVDNLAIANITLERTMTDMGSGTNDTYALGAPAGDPNSQGYCANLDVSVYFNRCGYHYRWGIATLGSGNFNTGNAPNSICPKGWKLPTHILSGVTEYSHLHSALGWGKGDDVNNIDEWRGLYVGYTYIGSSGPTLNGVGSYAYYLSSNIHNGTHSRSLYYTTGSVNPVSDVAIASAAMAVRCMLR